MNRWTEFYERERELDAHAMELLRISGIRGDWWRARVQQLRGMHPDADTDDIYREAYADQVQAIIVTGECP